MFMELITSYSTKLVQMSLKRANRERMAQYESMYALRGNEELQRNQ